MAHTRQYIYVALRWVPLLWGVLVLGVVLAQRGASLPWRDVLLLGAFSWALRQCTVAMRRGLDGEPTLFHTPGEAMVVIALMRDGPAAALLVNFLSLLLCRITGWREVRGHLLRDASNLFYLPALTWLGGCAYVALGGHRILDPADSARFFQEPTAVLLPLLAMLVLDNDLIHRTYMAALFHFRDGEPMRVTLRDPLFSLFDYVDNLSGALTLVLWTAWGWGTLPFTALFGAALLLAARAHFAKVEARREAESDPLTGLASWRGLENDLRRRTGAGRRRGDRFGLVFLDVDGLKLTNDRFGHAAGDELPRLVGETCRLHARERDLVGRRGGDEFLVLLDGLDRETAETVMRRLQRSIEDTLAVHPQFAGLAGVSAGLAVYPHDAHTPPALIELADGRMYADKLRRKAAQASAAAMATA